MITLKIENDDAVLSALKQISSAEMRADILDDVGAYGVSSTQQRFLDQESPDGEAWEQSYRAKAEGGSTLRDKDYLFQSLTHIFSADKVEWGSNKIYAAIHHFGGVIKAKSAKALRFAIGGNVYTKKQVTMPAREYLGVNDADRREIEAIVQNHILGGLPQ